jgi:membrane-bound lytic murein transglycosylase A
VPGRSIAIDRALHVYGTPFFIQADLPITNDKAATKFRRLVVAQDTGSAIVGTARADIYFGAGDEAARIAGRIKNPGRFVMLLPRGLDPVEAGRNMPLPTARPKPIKVAEPDGDTATVPSEATPAAEETPLPEERPATETSPAAALGPADASSTVPLPAAKPKKRRKE